MADNRAKILEVAERLFAQKGVQKTSLGDIASEAGISKGTLYYYYRSKDDLIYDLVDSTFDKITARLLQQMEELGERPQPRVLLEMTLAAIIREEELNRNTFYLMQEAFLGNEEVRRKFRQKYQEWRALISELLVKLVGFDPEDPSRLTLATIILAVIDGLSWQWLLDPGSLEPGPIAELAEQLLVRSGKRAE